MRVREGHGLDWLGGSRQLLDSLLLNSGFHGKAEWWLKPYPGVTNFELEPGQSGTALVRGTSGLNSKEVKSSASGVGLLNPGGTAPASMH